MHRHGSMCVNRRHEPTALCVFVCGLGACPCLYAPTPGCTHPELPKGPWERGLGSPLSQDPHILPRPYSFQLDLGPGADLGWGLAWRTQGGSGPTNVPLL